MKDLSTWKGVTRHAGTHFEREAGERRRSEVEPPGLLHLRCLLPRTSHCRRPSVAWKRNCSRNPPQPNSPSPQSLPRLPSLLAPSPRKPPKPHKRRRTRPQRPLQEAASLPNSVMHPRLCLWTASDLARHSPLPWPNPRNQAMKSKAHMMRVLWSRWTLINQMPLRLKNKLWPVLAQPRNLERQ